MERQRADMRREMSLEIENARLRSLVEAASSCREQTRPVVSLATLALDNCDAPSMRDERMMSAINDSVQTSSVLPAGGGVTAASSVGVARGLYTAVSGASASGL